MPDETSTLSSRLSLGLPHAQFHWQTFLVDYILDTYYMPGSVAEGGDSKMPMKVMT